MKKIEQIKEELIAIGVKHDDCRIRLNSIKGDNLIELFSNISKYIYWFKDNEDKAREFNNILGNQLVVEGGILLCDCTGMSSVTIPNSVTSIEDNAFEGCKELTSIKIPNSVTSIGDFAFRFCSGLTLIELPNSITSIGYCAFAHCKELKSIIIPNSVKSIGDYVFDGCSDDLEIIRK